MSNRDASHALLDRPLYRCVELALSVGVDVKPRRKITIGLRIVRLVVKSYAGRNKWNHKLWLCECDCGNERTFSSPMLNNPKRTNSCGCLYRENHTRACTKHGHAKTRSPTYSAWNCMITRCLPSHKHAEHYFYRGISVCERWRNSFEDFLLDMGPKPAGLELDRRDNNKGYCKDNCRWATRAEQTRNTRSNRLITYDGETKCLTDWALRLGISQQTLWARIKMGWPLDEALNTPANQRGALCRS